MVLTLIFHAKTVDSLNQSKFKQLTGNGKIFRALDSGSENFVYSLSHCLAEETLKLKVGAQVILLSNLDLKRGLGNGSQVIKLV